MSSNGSRPPPAATSAWDGASSTQMVATYENGAHGEMSKDEIKKRVKALMERNDVEPKRAGLLRSRRWYNRI